MGSHRLHRLRRTADPHRNVAPSRRRTGGMAGRDRVRRCHRGDEHLAGAGLDAARHLLCVAPAWCAWRSRRGRLLHRPRAGCDHRIGGGLPGDEPAHLDQGRGARCRSGGRACRAQRSTRAHSCQLAPRRSAPGATDPVGRLRRGGGARCHHARALSRRGAGLLRADRGSPRRPVAAAGATPGPDHGAAGRRGRRWAWRARLGRARRSVRSPSAGGS